MDKTHYKPLFDAGFHDIDTTDLESIFIKPFDKQERRKFLIKHLNKYLEQLKDVGAKFEIWIDGSFSTDKEEPNDIDIAIFHSEAEINGLHVDKKKLLKQLVEYHEEIKLRYYCDIYFIPDNDVATRSYWRGWFGFSRAEAPKGIPRLTI